MSNITRKRVEMRNRGFAIVAVVFAAIPDTALAHGVGFVAILLLDIRAPGTLLGNLSCGGAPTQQESTWCLTAPWERS